MTKGSPRGLTGLTNGGLGTGRLGSWEQQGGPPAGGWSIRAGTRVSGVAERGRVIEASNDANEREGEVRPSQRQ